MVTHLERRTIEAELLEKLLQKLTEELGEARALDIISTTLEQAAFEAGQQFAAQAPDGPSLKHFSTIVDVWKDGGAVNVCDSSFDGETFTLTVDRCSYVDTYREMGLSPKFARILSCNRDLPFAKGYSDKLHFQRKEYIGIGSPKCLFHYTWG